MEPDLPLEIFEPKRGLESGTARHPGLYLLILSYRVKNKRSDKVMSMACSSEVVKFNMIGIQPQKGANKINITKNRKSE